MQSNDESTMTRIASQSSTNVEAKVGTRGERKDDM